MQITVLGRTWRFQWMRRYRTKAGVVVGKCDPPDKPDRTLKLAKGLKGADLAEELLHEMIHAAQWHVTEEFVREFAADYRRAAEQLGLFNEQ